MKSRFNRRGVSLIPFIILVFTGFSCVNINSGNLSELIGVGLVVLVVSFVVRGRL